MGLLTERGQTIHLSLNLLLCGLQGRDMTVSPEMDFIGIYWAVLVACAPAFIIVEGASRVFDDFLVWILCHTAQTRFVLYLSSFFMAGYVTRLSRLLYLQYSAVLGRQKKLKSQSGADSKPPSLLWTLTDCIGRTYCIGLDWNSAGFFV